MFFASLTVYKPFFLWIDAILLKTQFWPSHSAHLWHVGHWSSLTRLATRQPRWRRYGPSVSVTHPHASLITHTRAGRLVNDGSRNRSPQHSFVGFDAFCRQRRSLAEFLLRWSVFVFQMPCCGLWACFYDNQHLIPAVCRKAAKIWWEISKLLYACFIIYS